MAKINWRFKRRNIRGYLGVFAFLLVILISSSSFAAKAQPVVSELKNTDAQNLMIDARSAISLGDY